MYRYNHGATIEITYRAVMNEMGRQWKFEMLGQIGTRAR
jgi:hypothetical protein